MNLASEQFLSALDAARLRWLLSMTAYAHVAQAGGETAAFLLAFREACAYDSVNYRWFSQRYPSFLYIDRVVVDARHQGRGLGAALYRDLFAFARRTGAPCVTCEIDVDPPNPVSSAFHARFGFREVGKQRYGKGDKLVSLQEARL